MTTGRPGVAAAILAVVLAACGGPADVPVDAPPTDAAVDAPVATPVGSPSSAPAPAAVVAAEPVPTATTLLPPDGVLPRSLTYGMLTWTIVAAAITDEDPRTYAAGVVGAPTSRTSLVLDLTLRNDNTLVNVVTSQARVTVTLPDGTVIPGKDLGRVSIPAVSQVGGRYAFDVPAGTGFEGLVVAIGDPGREPSFELPLDGTAPDVETVRTAETDITLDVPLPGIDMTWNIERIHVGRDWPLPVGHKGGTLPSSARSSAGHRWLGLVARVDVGRCACKGGVLDQSGSARLFIDDLPHTAVAAHSSSAILNASMFSDVMLVFEVPLASSAPTFQVGPLDDSSLQASVRLDID